MNYFFHLLVLLTFYVILSLSLNVLMGYSGLLSIAHAAFYGIGAYSTTLMMIKFNLSFMAALFAGVVVTMLLSLIVAIPSLRMRGDYFVLASLSFQVIAFSILYNWVELTRGPYGIPGIPKPMLFRLHFNSIPKFLGLSCAFALGSTFALAIILNSPFGRTLRAIRDDELAALALGKDVAKFKVQAFAIAAGFAAVAGGLYASYFTYISPTSFSIDESIFIVAIVLVGGSGNMKGPLIGSLFMVFLPELLRFLRIPDTIAANIRQIIYGSLLVILMRYRPQGILGTYKFE